MIEPIIISEEAKSSKEIYDKMILEINNIKLDEKFIIIGAVISDDCIKGLNFSCCNIIEDFKLNSVILKVLEHMDKVKNERIKKFWG